MGHTGVKGLHSAVDDLPPNTVNDSTHPSCEVCARANIKRSPFPKQSSHRASRLLERIHCDICGPLPNCYGNFSYYILFIDCYSRFITLFLMKSRSEALSLFIQFQTAAERFCGEKIKTLRVDNAPELTQGQMMNHCKAHGITYEKTVPDSPPQNGVAERTNLTVCSMARAMLIDANLRDFFWPFAVLTAVHIKQRIPHSALPPNITPFQLWFGHRPSLSHLRPFGTKCTTRVISNHLTKFQPRGEIGRFLGYAKDAKGYLIWVTNSENNSGTLKVRRDVIFHDFPTPTPSPPIPQHYLPLWENVEFPDHLAISPDCASPESTTPSPIRVSTGNGHLPTQMNESITIPRYVNTQCNKCRVSHKSHPHSRISSDDGHPNVPRAKTRFPPHRNAKLPAKYSDYIPSNDIVEQLLRLDDEELTLPLPDGPASAHPIISHILEADLALDGVANLTTNNEPDPPSVRHAQRSRYWNEWLAAMHEELEALKAKEVYEEVSELPPGRKAVQCKWVLRIKRDKDGQISRFKGRLVAKGFTQVFGQDFTFTFAPVARWDSIRSILCIAALKDYELRHIDVKNAYLNAPLQEEIYMVAPEGCGSRYWRLRKGLYGLRQAGRQWYLHLHEAYSSLGFTRCQSDWSVYIRNTPSALSISATSVDDLLLASNSKTESDLATTQIKHKFAITDGGDTEWLLGCRIRRWRDRRLLTIDQEQYMMCYAPSFIFVSRASLSRHVYYRPVSFDFTGLLRTLPLS